MKKFLPLLFFLCMAGTAEAVCTHYASQAGGGNGLALGTPFTIAAFFALPPVAGNELCLIDGTYTGANSMIVPPVNLSGSSGNPIKIFAINDGAVLIDGEGVRRPIGLFQNNDWWHIKGVNAKNSNHNVVGIAGNSDNNVIERVCAWDAPGTSADNFMVFSVSRSTGNKIIESCGFGKGRKIFDNSDLAVNTTVRMSFGIWMESARTGPKMVFTNTYDSTGAIFEDNIGMWHQNMNPTEPYAVFAQDGITDLTFAPNYRANSKYLGGMSFYRTTHTISTSILGALFGSRSVADTEFRNMVLHMDQGAHTTVRPIQAQLFDGGSAGKATCAPSCDRRLTDITEIGFTTPSSINTTSNGWTVTNRQAYANAAAAITANASPFRTSTGTGARACFRYVNGSLTSTKRWPHPMDDRINAALTLSGRSPATFFGVGKDLTTYVEGLFGIIPEGCKTTTGGGGGGGGPRGPSGVIIF